MTCSAAPTGNQYTTARGSVAQFRLYQHLVALRARVSSGGLIIEHRPRLWLHGHSHASVSTQIGETTVLCNPLGYAVEEVNSEFLDRLIVALPGN